MSMFGLALLMILLAAPMTADQVTPAQPAGTHIRVSGADVNNVIPIDTAGTNPHRVILLQETRGVPVNAHLDLWTVMTPDGARLDLNPTLCDTNGAPVPDPLQFDAQSVIRICLDPRLPAVGSYKAALSLLYSDTSDGNNIVRDTYTLAIERHPPANVVTLSGLPVGPTDTGFQILPPGVTPDLELRVTLTETAGLGTSVSKPELLELSQFGPNDTSVQVSPLGAVKVVDENGNPAPDDISLQPYETRAFRLILAKQLPAGQFRARVQVRTADAGIAQSTIDVRLRHNWMWAFLVIICGALASFMLRTWIDSGRARAVQDQKLQEQLRQIPSGIWPGNRLNQLLVSQLEAARTSLQLGQSIDVDARCALVQELLPQIDEINQHLDAAGLTDSEKDFVDGEVSDARDRLLALFNSSSPTAQDRTDAQGALKLVLAAIEHAQDAGRIQKQIVMADELAGNPLLAPNQKLMIAHAAAAQNALEAGDLDKAQSEISLALAPNGLSDDLCEQLTAIVAGWNDCLKVAVPAGSDPTHDAARAVIEQLDTQIQVLRTTPAADVQHVLLDYNAVLVQMASAVTTLPDAVRTAMKSDAKLALPQQWRPASPRPAAGIARRFKAITPRTARRRHWLGQFSISLKDDGVSIISIVVSALVGLQLLWVTNATFGGLNDYITALVWGFGLHQLNETVRQAGPSAITSVLRNPKAQA